MHRCDPARHRDREEEIFFKTEEDRMFSFPPPELVVFFRLMFRESEAEAEEHEHFKVAPRQESVLLEICGSHFVVCFVGCFLAFREAMVKQSVALKHSHFWIQILFHFGALCFQVCISEVCPVEAAGVLTSFRL